MAGELVLVVEDNVLNRKLVRDVLQSQGYTVLETETAEDGLKIARAKRPALILMDLQLPGMDGFSATRILRDDPVTRGIRVIAVTASVIPTDRRDVLSFGFEGRQVKRVSVGGLLDEVRGVLDDANSAAPVSDAARLRSQPSVASPARDGHVLVVDDTPQNVKLLADVLRGEGYRVSAAASG